MQGLVDHAVHQGVELLLGQVQVEPRLHGLDSAAAAVEARQLRTWVWGGGKKKISLELKSETGALTLLDSKALCIVVFLWETTFSTKKLQVSRFD